MRAMFWVPVDVALPEDGQAVLVRYARDNWICDHTLSDGSHHETWRWQAARFVVGRTAAEAEKAGEYRPQDEIGNNQRPYCWEEFGSDELFGQDVTHWAAISDPCEPPNVI